MDVEDAKKRLNFIDVSVRRRCINKLVATISKKKAKVSANVKIPEINLLLDTCGNECYTTSMAACDGLFQLVADGYLELGYAINNILSSLSSSKNSGAMVGIVSKLVLLQMDSNACGKENPRSIKFPKHPLIIILENKPNIWPLVLDSIIQAIEDCPKSFSFMEPVVSYMLMNPYNVSDHIAMHSSLLERLIPHFDRSQIANYFFKVLPWFQVFSFEKVAEATRFLSRFKDVIMELPSSDEKLAMMEKLLFVMLALCHNCLKYAYNPTNTLKVIESIAEHLAKAENAITIYYNASLVSIPILLQSTSGSHTQQLLNIGHLLMRRKVLSSIVAAMMMGPVVLLLAEPKEILPQSNQTSNFSLTSFCRRLKHLTCMQRNTTKISSELCESDSCILEQFTSFASQSVLCAKFCAFLDGANDEIKIQWLSQVKSMAIEGVEISNFVFHLVVGLFLSPTESENLFILYVEVFEALCSKERNNTYSTKMFALLLYKLKMETNPKHHFYIMEYLAKTVGHKYAVSPVLNVFRMMANQQELKAQAVYLMFLLCKKQDRCFPYLQGMLTTNDKTVSLQSGLNEVRIAQAAVIKELCMENPASATQLLGALSTIINLSNDESSTPAVVLALDGVIHMCKSAVIDLRSVWKNLSPKLCADKRSQVTIAMCRLLNLVPALQVKSFEYEKFMKDTSAYLWRLISQSTLSPLVTSAAYEALAGYPISCYSLKQLPEAAKVNLKLPASMVNTPFDMGKLPEDVLDYIPGYCFIDLLKSMEDPTLLKGYKNFLKSLISEEVSELPRSVYSRRKLVGKARNANNILSGIPCVLCSKKSSTTQKDLAVGILLSYETPLDMDKEGKPTRQSVLNQLRLFEEVSIILLNEVNLECNDWQRCLLLPAAWCSFMERAFFACEESRRASLDYQKSERKLEGSAEEVAIMYGTAWLWVRDRLLDLIKRNATKNNTASPLANSIFAIVGLVRATNKFYSELDSELKEFSKNCTKHPSHEVFQRQCTETILNAFDPQYLPSFKVFSWLLTHLPKQSTTSGAIVRGCAAASLYQLLPVIQKEFSAKIKDIFTVFSQHLLKDNSPTLIIYSGIGLGYFVKSICQTSVLDCHNDQVDLILSVVESLDACCKIEEFVTGKLVALTLVVSGMCLNGSRLFIPWIENICESVQARLRNENKNSMLYEFVSICSSSILASAASVNLLPTSTLLNVATSFYDQQREMPQCSSTAISLAIAIDSLSRLGEPEGTRMSEVIRKTWLGTLASEKMPTLHRIAALNGLCSLFSSGKGLVQINKGLTAAGSITDGLKDLVQLMLQLLNATKNQSLYSICSWEIGRLFAVHSGQQDNSLSTLPSSYNYLSERSILKPLTAFLQEPFPIMTNVERGHVSCGLTALSFSFPRPLPPLHWTAFLTPFVKNTEDCEILEACLKIALYQKSSSASALFLLVSYATPPLFHGLPQNCQLMLRGQIPTLSTSLSQNQLQQFLQIAVTSQIVNKEIKDADAVIISQGILEAIRVTSSNQETVKVLMNTLKEILLCLNTSSGSSVKTLMDTMYEHIGTWPEAIQDLFLQDLENDECIGLLVLFLGYYIKAGKKPLTCLRHAIELGKHAPETSQKAILTSLLNCLVLGTTVPESDVGKPGKLISFLLETMGWLRVLTDSSSKHQLSTPNEVALFLFDICMTVIIGSASFFVSYTFWPETNINHKTLIQNLPDALSVLSCNSAWGEGINKVLDQLFSLRKSSFLDDKDRFYIQAAFCALRSSEEFRKPTLWTEIVPKAVPYV